MSGAVGRSQVSEGTLVAGPQLLLTTLTQTDPIKVRFGIADTDQMRWRSEAASGPLVLPPHGAFDGRGEAGRRQRVSAQGQAAVQRHARVGQHRHRRGRGRGAQPRRRAQAGPVRARAPQRRHAAQGDAWCRRARCSKARRASSSTWWPTTRRMPRPVQVGDQIGDQWIISQGPDGGRPGDRRRHGAHLLPGAPVQIAQAPAGGASAPVPRPAGGAGGGTAKGEVSPPRRAGRLEVSLATDDKRGRACSRASSSTARSSRPCCRSSSSSPACAAMRTLPIAQYPEIAPPVVTVLGRLSRRQRRGARADRGRAARERHQRRRAHDLHGLDVDRQRRRDDPGHLRDRHRRRPGRAATSTTASSRPRPSCRRKCGARASRWRRARRRSCRCWRSSPPDGSYDDLTISNYVTLNVLDQLKRVPGTTNVQIFGAKDYAMRIWLQPDRLAQLQAHHRRHRARDQRAERAVRRRQGRPGARPAGRRRWSTPSPRRAGCPSRSSSRRSSCAPTPTAARCA